MDKLQSIFYFFSEYATILIPFLTITIGLFIKIMTITDFDQLFLTKEKKLILKIASFFLFNLFSFLLIIIVGIGLSVLPYIVLSITWFFVGIFFLIISLGTFSFYKLKKEDLNCEKNCKIYKFLFFLMVTTYLITLLSFVAIIVINQANETTIYTVKDNRYTIIQDQSFIEDIISLFLLNLSIVYIFSVALNVINRNRASFRVTNSNVNEIAEERFKVLYSLDSNTLVLGDGIDESNSKELLLFNKSDNSVIKFTRS